MRQATIRSARGNATQRHYDGAMQIGYDSDRQDGTLRQRGLDCARAREVFAGRHCTAEDLREPWGEPRLVTVGLLHCRMVAMVWAKCGAAPTTLSIRKANPR